MRFIKPSEFDFIEHWNDENKKYIASFFYKISKYYRYIEQDEFINYVKYRVFIEYKKNNNLQVNPNLLGKIRVELFRTNKKRSKELEQCMDLHSFGYLNLNNNVCDNCDIAEFIDDITKICCKKTGIAVLKKINKEELTSNEYKLLKKNREKIIDYINL